MISHCRPAQEIRWDIGAGQTIDQLKLYGRCRPMGLRSRNPGGENDEGIPIPFCRRRALPRPALGDPRLVRCHLKRSLCESHSLQSRWRPGPALDTLASKDAAMRPFTPSCRPFLGADEALLDRIAERIESGPAADRGRAAARSPTRGPISEWPRPRAIRIMAEPTSSDGAGRKIGR